MILAQLLSNAPALPEILDILRNIVLGGTGVWAAVEAGKKIEAVPLEEGQTVRLRAVAGVLSALATVLVAVADKNLQPDSLQNVALAVLTFAGTWAAAHGAHKLNKAVKGGGTEE